MCTEFTYVNLFSLKELSGEGGNHLRSPPVLPSYTLPRLVKISGKLKEEFLDNETRSFPLSLRYGGNRQTKRKSNFCLVRLLTLCLFIILLRFVTFCPELNEYIPNSEIMRYAYYNKINADHV